MEIKIFDVVEGKNAVSMILGDKLYQIIKSELDKHTDEKIELDFSQIEVCASPFLNASIGYLFKDYSKEIIQAKISLTNIDDRDKSLVNKVIKNAIYQYENPNQYKQLIENIENEM